MPLFINFGAFWSPSPFGPYLGPDMVKTWLDLIFKFGTVIRGVQNPRVPILVNFGRQKISDPY